jgi:hypothetical protein
MYRIRRGRQHAGSMLWFGTWLPLSVSIASVSYDADVHEARVAVERLDDVVGHLQLDVSTRPWTFRQSLDTGDDPPRHSGLQAFEFAPI